ncbi:hypothetical protein H1R20_g87, partial [Candolleomyces eurysporus]
MSSSKDDPSAVLGTRDSHPEVGGFPSSQNPQCPGGVEDGMLGQDNCASVADSYSVPGVVQDQITAPSGKGSRKPRKSVKASLQAETSPGDTPSVSTSASSAKKPAKRTSKKSKKPGADSLKNGGPAAATTFRFISGDNTLGPQAVSEASIPLTGVPPETHEGVAPPGSVEHVGTPDSIAQPTDLPRKRGRKKVATTPTNTLPPQDDSTSVSVKEEQATTLSAVSSAPKKTKKPLKEQKSWKVVPNSSESMHRSWQPSNSHSCIASDSGQHSKRYSIPRVWTSDKTELQASLPNLGPAKGVNGISWTHSHTPFVVLDDGPRPTRPVDLVQLNTGLKDEFVCDLLLTRALVTVGGSAKANIAEAFDPIPVVDVGTSTLPSISTSSKQVHFAEGTKEDDGPAPRSAEDTCAIATSTLPPSPPAEDTSMTPETRDVAPELEAPSLEQPNFTPSLAPQEPHDIPTLSENPIHRIHHILDHAEQTALNLASDSDVTLPWGREGQGEPETRSSIGGGGEGSGLTEGPEGAAAAQPVSEVEGAVVPDKSMDIDIDYEPPPPGMSSPLTELSSDEGGVEAYDAADMMDVDVDQPNPSPSTSTSASSSSKIRALPCGCGKTWVYTDCEVHHWKGSISASMLFPMSEETNESPNRPKRKAAVQTSLRIQDQTKKQYPRRSKAEAKKEEPRVKEEEVVVEAAIANAAQPETKSEPELKEKGSDAMEKGIDVPVVESPMVSVSVKVAKHSKKRKVKTDAPIPEGAPENTISSRPSTVRKRKGREEDGKETAPEAEEALPLPSSRKRRRENTANEQVVVVPPAMAEGDASSSCTTVLESAAPDGQLALAPCTESLEAVTESRPLETCVSQPAHVDGVTNTSAAIPSSLQPEMEPQSASAITSTASSSEPVVDANVPSDVVMVEGDASLAKEGLPPTPATEPTPLTVPGETHGPADESTSGYGPLPSLPSEIRALIDAYVAGTPLVIMASRSRILELASRSLPQLDVPEEYGFACLGLFKILGLEEKKLPSATATANVAAPVHVEWKFRLEWSSGGEDILKQKHSDWDLARPWWTIPQTVRQGTSTPCQSDPPETVAQDLPIPPNTQQCSSSPETATVPSQSTSSSTPNPTHEAESGSKEDNSDSSPPKIDTPQIYLHLRKAHPTYGVEHTLIESGFYSLIPESLLSHFTPSLSNESFPSGWFCTACGKVNFQAAMRHRKCSGLVCSKGPGPTLSYAQELSDIRGIFSESPSCLPFNDYAQDVRGSSTSWNNGMRTLGYHFDEKSPPPPSPLPDGGSANNADSQARARTSGGSVTGDGIPQAQNGDSNPKAASELVKKMQSEVELRRPMGDGSNPFFEHTHDLASPISGSNDEVVAGVSGKSVPVCLVDAGKLLFKRATAYAETPKERMVISRLNFLAYITAGTKKNQDILCTKKHPIAILCLGCDVIMTLTPKKITAVDATLTTTKKAGRKASKKGKGKEPEVKVQVAELDMSTLIPFEDAEKPVNVENGSENGEEELPDDGPGVEAEGSAGDKDPPMASSSSSQFQSVALVTASKLPEETVQVTMVHGDVLVLSGEDYVFSLKRTGCGILVFGSKAV